MGVRAAEKAALIFVGMPVNRPLRATVYTQVWFRKNLGEIVLLLA